MKHTTQQKGFTLIEMLIVIAIVGILSAVALPIYQQYIARAQMKEGVSLGMSAQPLIEDYIHRTGAFPPTAQLATLGLPTNASGGILGAASATIANVTTTPGATGIGTITVSLRADLRPEVASTSIIYSKSAYAATTTAGVVTVTDAGTWSCAVTLPSAGADMDLMPDGCSASVVP